MRTVLRHEATVDDSLDDFDYGDWTGKTREEAAVSSPSLFESWQRDPSTVQFPGGEGVGAAFLGLIGRTHPGATVLAVTHDVVIRCAVCTTLGSALTAYHRIAAVDLASTTGLLITPPRLLWMNRR